MKKIKVSTGIFWVEIPAADLRILCGCPADSVKHLRKNGLIANEEKNGVLYETGPNAILLSDVPLQNERFANLAEFPVLQMLYRQGMILPNHPNNTGVRPLLIGTAEQVKAQTEYIYRGNYGLTTLEEFLEAGVHGELARDLMRMKLHFAFDRIRQTDEFVDTRIVGRRPVELRNGAFVGRLRLNVYEFTHDGLAVSVDLNLPGRVEYEAPYHLGFHDIRREYFSVIHSGEGDGWDINRPCMASILTFQGRIYLIDAGPNLLHSLQALGIGISEIEGIFQTHAHDDHFNALPVLMRSDHRIKYFATPLVRRSVMRKFAALTSLGDEQFRRYFDVRDLEADRWNAVEGLEVRPVYSPHPVETTILFFRALWGEGYRSYAHVADAASFAVLERMVTDDPSHSGISRAYCEGVKGEYLTPVDLKKIDIGGGLIHGSAEDFRGDTSGKILLSHTALTLTDRQKEIGDNTSFGVADVLIPATQDYSKQTAYGNLRAYFPAAPAHEVQMLLNCPVAAFTPGSILVRKGEHNRSIFLLLSGVMEFIVHELGVNNKLTAGSLAGELSGILGTAARGTYRALSYARTLQIPRDLYVEFLKRNGLLETMHEDIRKRRDLQNTWLFGERLSCPLKHRIAKAMTLEAYPRGWELPQDAEPALFLLQEGEVEIFSEDGTIETLAAGDFFGEERVLFGATRRYAARATKDSRVYRIPPTAFEDIPIVHWKLFETYERRVNALEPSGAYQ